MERKRKTHKCSYKGEGGCNGKERPLSWFSASKTKKGKLQSYCKKCSRRYRQEWKYAGDSIAKKEKRLRAQKYRCKVCESPICGGKLDQKVQYL